MSDKTQDRIIDGMSEQELRGAVMQFNYHGWLISFSQVFTRSSVAIFKGKTELFDLPSVGFAIEQIDRLNSERYEQN